MKRRYEIRDDQWEIIKTYCPLPIKKLGERRPKDHKMMLNALFRVARTGAPWRDLPKYYGSWSSVYSRFRSWQKAGIGDQI
ncbi:transposase [Paenibacillus sp. JCM 10914]|uniref:transposase n=1 Tax=Paenibacillus sp. JCM 10914 TaxID=1236974 RepID=UPI00351C4C1E